MANSLVLLLSIAVFSQLFLQGLHAATFTFQSKCTFTVWPATLAGASSPQLLQTGFELASGAKIDLDAPPNWSGRMWARTSCTTHLPSGGFTCLTGDCGSDRISCNGAGGKPPTTLVEFTLNGSGGKDFYDTSLVDGFNVPMSISPTGGSANSSCLATACPADVNAACPPELQLKGTDGATVVGCRSACDVFGMDQYCCTGAYGSPQACKPTHYSRIFKSSCPQAYSYPYDDTSSTFTCAGANYLILFCP